MIKELTEAYLSALEPKGFKELLIKDIFTEKLNEDSSDFFIKLIEYVHPIVPSIDKNQLSQLLIAASSFYNYVLFIDKIVDKGLDNLDSLSYQKRVIEATSAIELSTIELYDIFKSDITFWKKYRFYKKQYFDAIFEERVISEKNSKINAITFKRIAEGKHALAEFLIVCMFMLNKNDTVAEDDEKEVIKCVQNIFYTMQIFDDIEDFAEDSDNGIWTYPQSSLIDFIDSENITLTKEQEHLKLQLFYVSGIAVELLNGGLQKLKVSKEITKELNLKQLELFIDRFIDKINGKIDLINNLINKAKQKQQS